MNSCPCCSEQMLRHARQKEVYWFCTYCRQEMPNFSYITTNRAQCRQQLERLIGHYGAPVNAKV